MSMIPRIRLATALLFISIGLAASAVQPLTARAGGVDNGGGVAEKNVLFSYLELGHALDICLQSDSCKLNPIEVTLLTKIRFNLIAELNAKMQILFKSEKAEPGFFMVDGFLRIAKTGNKIGDPIFVNLDLLYPSDMNGDVIPLSIGGATALLVHELGHHLGWMDHTSLDLLGSKVQMMVMAHTQELTHGRYQGQMTATLVDFFAKNTATHLLLSDGNQQLDASAKIVDAARCFDGRVPVGVWLWNPRWDLYAIYKPDAEGVSNFPLRTEMVLTCPTPTYDGFMESHHQLVIEAKVKKDAAGRYHFASDALQVSPIDCQESPLMDCH